MNPKTTKIMTLAELKARLNDLPCEYDNFIVSCDFSDYDIILPIQDVRRQINVEDGDIILTIKR